MNKISVIRVVTFAGLGLCVLGLGTMVFAFMNPLCISPEDAIRLGVLFHCVPNTSWPTVAIFLSAFTPGAFLFVFGRAYLKDKQGSMF